MTHQNTALLLTGAAARISQEVALIDQLIAKKDLVLDQENTLLSGFSSGSLNLFAINACFQKNAKINWDNYYKEEILWNLVTSDVYTGHNLPFDTLPLRTKVEEMLIQAGYYSTGQEVKKKVALGELPFQSHILTFSYHKLKTIWFSSKKNEHHKISLTDLLMASTAIPVIFPKQSIELTDGEMSNITKGHFADGGTGGTFKHFEDNIGEELKQVKEVFIVSPMREREENLVPEISKLPISLKWKPGCKTKHSSFISNLSMKGFVKFLDELQTWCLKQEVDTNKFFVCIPNLPENFPIIKFGFQQCQWEKTMSWAEKNPDQLAIPLNEFLAEWLEKLNMA